MRFLMSRLPANGSSRVIICWNYLYLSQKLAEIDDPAKREELLQAVAHGSAAAWGHLNLLGEYDFSEDRLPGLGWNQAPKTPRCKATFPSRNPCTDSSVFNRAGRNPGIEKYFCQR